MDILRISERARDYNANIGLHEAIAVQDSEKVFVDLNIKQMLNSKDSNDELIEPEYSENYRRFKGFPNPNLKVSGDFHEGTFLITNENEGTYFMSSFDHKMPLLVARYGEPIFGIAPSNESKATREASKNMFNNYVREVWKR